MNKTVSHQLKMTNRPTFERRPMNNSRICLFLTIIIIAFSKCIEIRSNYPDIESHQLIQKRLSFLDSASKNGVLSYDIDEVNRFEVCMRYYSFNKLYKEYLEAISFLDSILCSHPNDQNNLINHVRETAKESSHPNEMSFLSGLHLINQLYELNYQIEGVDSTFLRAYSKLANEARIGYFKSRKMLNILPFNNKDYFILTVQLKDHYNQTLYESAPGSSENLTALSSWEVASNHAVIRKIVQLNTKRKVLSTLDTYYKGGEAQFIKDLKEELSEDLISILRTSDDLLIKVTITKAGNVSPVEYFSNNRALSQTEQQYLKNFFFATHGNWKLSEYHLNNKSEHATFMLELSKILRTNGDKTFK